MERDLQSISDITDGGCAFVCDNAGDVIATSDPPGLATVTMNQIGRAAAQVFQAMSAAGRPADRAEFQYDAWHLFARDIGAATVLIVMRPGADLPFVRMATDSAVVGWRADKNVQKRLARLAAIREAPLAIRRSDERDFRGLRAQLPGARV